MPNGSTVADPTRELTDAEFIELFDGAWIYEAAEKIGMSETALRRRIQKRGLSSEVRSVMKPLASTASSVKQTERGERPGIKLEGDDCTIVSGADANPAQLGDAETLIKGRNLNPDDWIITNIVVNTWDAMTAIKPKGHAQAGENAIVQMHQLKVTMKRKGWFNILSPATHVPPLSRLGKRVTKGEPEYILVESDHQIPFHDPRLHEAVLALASKVEPHEWDLLGDFLDFSTISRHGDHPATNDITPQLCVDVGYRIMRDKREASPHSKMKKLKGNHDWRLESEQLNRSERIYNLTPAEEDIPCLDLRRLLHLDKMDIELVTDPRGWEHAEIEIVPGTHGLVARHGWLTGNNTAERSVKARGRSMIVGHIHKREHSFFWDPSMEVERQGMVIGCMCLVRGERYPHYVACDRWLQGLGMVTRWPDGRWEMEHLRWENGVLSWRGDRFTA